jgi:hypothetical protein
MMNSVLAGKPDWIAESHSRQQAHNELKGAAGPKSPVCEITMQSSTQAEGIQQTETHARKPVDQSRAGEDSDNWQNVQTNNED